MKVIITRAEQKAAIEFWLQNCIGVTMDENVEWELESETPPGIPYEAPPAAAISAPAPTRRGRKPKVVEQEVSEGPTEEELARQLDAELDMSAYCEDTFGDTTETEAEGEVEVEVNELFREDDSPDEPEIEEPVPVTTAPNSRRGIFASLG